jgi:hypothetical protein
MVTVMQLLDVCMSKGPKLPRKTWRNFEDDNKFTFLIRVGNMLYMVSTLLQFSSYNRK